jgi:PAS domain S-box-containing protein
VIRLNSNKLLNLETEEEFRTIFEGANDGILVADTKTMKFVLANPKICKIIGYSSKELLKLSVKDIHPKEKLSYVIGQFKDLAKKKITFTSEIPILRKDKKVIYCEINAKIMHAGKQKLLVGFFRDVTEKKLAEETLKEK